MTKIIFIAGSPGSGKTTISKLIHEKIKDSILIELSWIRGFHLDSNWSNASKEEENMSFENLIFILKNYIKHEYPYVIVNDLRDERILQIPKIFPKKNYFIFSLYVEKDEILKNRVLDSKRDSGFRDYQKAIDWNKKLIKRPATINEFKMDNTFFVPNYIAEVIKDTVTITPAEQKTILKDIYKVGKHKPVGYLPIQTIEKYCRLDPKNLIKKFKSKGLETMLLSEDESNIGSGALFVYDYLALSKLLTTNSLLLKKNKWPIDPHQFIKHLKNTAKDPELFTMIMHAFADPRLKQIKQ